MPANRQLIVTGGQPGEQTGGLGAKRDVLRSLERFNTAPDGSVESRGVAFGPGFHVELPWVDDRDPVNQALLTVADEETAWPVVSRMCKELGWTMMDAETGQAFGA